MTLIEIAKQAKTKQLFKHDADDADYFCKVTLDNLLKSGSERNESDGKRN